MTETVQEGQEINRTVGPYTWKILHTIAANYPCESCRSFFEMSISGMHDLVNIHLDKPVFDKQNLEKYFATVKTLEAKFRGKPGIIDKVRGVLESIKNKLIDCPTCQNNAIAPIVTEPEPENPRKILNTTKTEITSGDRNGMVTFRDTGYIYGASHGAKIAERLFEEIDKKTNRAALPVTHRPSTWLNIGLGVGLPLIAVMTNWVKSPDAQLALVVAGAHMSTKVEDYVEEALSKRSFTAFRPAQMQGQRIPAVPAAISSLDTLTPRSPPQIF